MEQALFIKKLLKSYIRGDLHLETTDACSMITYVFFKGSNTIHDIRFSYENYNVLSRLNPHAFLTLDQDMINDKSRIKTISTRASDILDYMKGNTYIKDLNPILQHYINLHIYVDYDGLVTINTYYIYEHDIYIDNRHICLTKFQICIEHDTELYTVSTHIINGYKLSEYVTSLYNYISIIKKSNPFV